MKTFAVIGLGKFGMAAALQLAHMDCEVLAVDKDMDKVNLIANHVTSAICGDAREESVLKSLGIRNYDCVIAAIGDSLADSILITLMLKEMGIKKVVCKASDNQHEKVLKKIGADMVIIPERDAGKKVAATLLSNKLLDLIDISEDYSIADCIVPKAWVGKSLAELSVRRKYKVNIVAVKNETDGDKSTVNISPGADYVFKETDVAILIGDTNAIQHLNNI
ncbi:MAG: TrkA family potassium uptake protein [Clostridia bacterium]|nr:TrkA family potassium uptake protein [Clostridia bacterium]